MTLKIYQPGESFDLHFVWRLPDGDYLRAIFAAVVVALDPSMERYLLQLTHFVAGRQESADGEPRAKADYNRDHWPLIDTIPGSKLQIAYEAADGRSLHLRLDTLTGEHSFFSRIK